MVLHELCESDASPLCIIGWSLRHALSYRVKAEMNNSVVTENVVQFDLLMYVALIWSYAFNIRRKYCMLIDYGLRSYAGPVALARNRGQLGLIYVTISCKAAAQDKLVNGPYLSIVPCLFSQQVKSSSPGGRNMTTCFSSFSSRTIGSESWFYLFHQLLFQ